MSEQARQQHLQRLFGRKLSTPATITTPGEGSVDDGGGWDEGTPTTEEVLCRFGPIGDTPQERAVAAKYESLSLWTIKVPVATVIKDTAEIAILGDTYIVIEPLAPRSFEILRRIVCRKKDPVPEPEEETP